MHHTRIMRHGSSLFLATALLITTLSAEAAGSSRSSRNPAASEKKPSVPTGLKGIWSGTKQVSLAWNAVKGATRYNLKRSKTPGGPYTLVKKQKRTTYKDTKVTIGTGYYYVVSAVNAGGEGANSAEVSPTPPPTGLAAVAADSQVALSWIKCAGATRYNVKRAAAPGGPFSPATLGLTVLDSFREQRHGLPLQVSLPSAFVGGSPPCKSKPSPRSSRRA